MEEPWRAYVFLGFFSGQWGKRMKRAFPKRKEGRKEGRKERRKAIDLG